MNYADWLPSTAGSMLYYRQLESFSEKDHGTLGVSLTANPYAYLADNYALPINADEFTYAAVCYPIVFTSQSKIPVVLMGPWPGVNVFMAQDGSMDPDAYLPAFALQYPFFLQSTDGSQDSAGAARKITLCIDRAAKTISDKPEIPFFENGEHSQFTKDAIAACNRYEELARRTRDFIRIIEKHDLFESMTLNVPRANPDGTEAPPQKIETCLRISEQKLNALPNDVYIKLRNMGIPGLMYAHLLSLNLWPKLLSRAARMNAAVPQR